VKAPGLVRVVREVRGLGGGDGEAKGLDLPDVVAELAIDIGAGLLPGMIGGGSQ
jgi:hypothetical protein